MPAKSLQSPQIRLKLPYHRSLSYNRNPRSNSAPNPSPKPPHRSNLLTTRLTKRKQLVDKIPMSNPATVPEYQAEFHRHAAAVLLFFNASTEHVVQALRAAVAVYERAYRAGRPRS